MECIHWEHGGHKPALVRLSTAVIVRGGFVLAKVLSDLLLDALSVLGTRTTIGPLAPLDSKVCQSKHSIQFHDLFSQQSIKD